ncbi:MAG: hypothetical protein HC866_21970 [Leptolyngbyaceae cyanobacterium RU_5_1]|nr:hypothetical protein [Leptolyngbyaceae cyanobacterium RU_5_1]
MAMLIVDGQNRVRNNVRGQNLNSSSFFKTRFKRVCFESNAQGRATQLRGINFSESIWMNVNAIFAPIGNFGTTWMRVL